MRSPIVGPTLLVLAGLSAMPGAGQAQEPLFLRIRPSAVELGSGGDRDAEAQAAARARAAREAVWARSDRRARIAIASVCTGCLKPIAPFAIAAPVAAPTSPEAAAPPTGPTRSAALSPTIGDP